MDAEVATHGHLVVIKRNGDNGIRVPLLDSEYTIGRHLDCDVRIQVATVSARHTMLKVNDKGEVMLFNMSNTNPTLINGVELNNVPLRNGDTITIGERSFRFEKPLLARKPLITITNNADATPTNKQSSPMKSPAAAGTVEDKENAPSTPATMANEFTGRIFAQKKATPKTPAQRRRSISTPKSIQKSSVTNTPTAKSTSTPKMQTPVSTKKTPASSRKKTPVSAVRRSARKATTPAANAAPPAPPPPPCTSAPKISETAPEAPAVKPFSQASFLNQLAGGRSMLKSVVSKEPAAVDKTATESVQEVEETPVEVRFNNELMNALRRRRSAVGTPAKSRASIAGDSQDTSTGSILPSTPEVAAAAARVSMGTDMDELASTDNEATASARVNDEKVDEQSAEEMESEDAIMPEATEEVLNASVEGMEEPEVEDVVPANEEENAQSGFEELAAMNISMCESEVAQEDSAAPEIEYDESGYPVDPQTNGCNTHVRFCTPSPRAPAVEWVIFQQHVEEEVEDDEQWEECEDDVEEEYTYENDEEYATQYTNGAEYYSPLVQKQQHVRFFSTPVAPTHVRFGTPMTPLNAMNVDAQESPAPIEQATASPAPATPVQEVVETATVATPVQDVVETVKAATPVETVPAADVVTPAKSVAESEVATPAESMETTESPVTEQTTTESASMKKKKRKVARYFVQCVQNQKPVGGPFLLRKVLVKKGKNKGSVTPMTPAAILQSSRFLQESFNSPAPVAFTAEAETASPAAATIVDEAPVAAAVSAEAQTGTTPCTPATIFKSSNVGHQLARTESGDDAAQTPSSLMGEAKSMFDTVESAKKVRIAAEPEVVEIAPVMEEEQAEVADESLPGTPTATTVAEPGQAAPTPTTLLGTSQVRHLLARSGTADAATPVSILRQSFLHGPIHHRMASVRVSSNGAVDSPATIFDGSIVQQYSLVDVDEDIVVRLPVVDISLALADATEEEEIVEEEAVEEETASEEVVDEVQVPTECTVEEAVVTDAKDDIDVVESTTMDTEEEVETTVECSEETMPSKVECEEVPVDTPMEATEAQEEEEMEDESAATSETTDAAAPSSDVEVPEVDSAEEEKQYFRVLSGKYEGFFGVLIKETAKMYKLQFDDGTETSLAKSACEPAAEPSEEMAPVEEADASEEELSGEDAPTEEVEATAEEVEADDATMTVTVISGKYEGMEATVVKETSKQFRLLFADGTETSLAKNACEVLNGNGKRKMSSASSTPSKRSRK